MYSPQIGHYLVSVTYLLVEGVMTLLISIPFDVRGALVGVFPCWRLGASFISLLPYAGEFFHRTADAAKDALQGDILKQWAH